MIFWEKKISMKLSIIVPTYNEEKTILKVLEEIKKFNLNIIDYEIIIIDDGSTDNTKSLLEKNKFLYNKVIFNSANKGKGFSVKEGIKASTGTHIIFQDADLEYNPKDYKKFIDIFLKFDADGIIGSRFVYSNYTRSHNFLNKIGNHLLTLTFNILYNTTFTDIYSCYFAFKKELLNVNEIKANGFDQHAEILCEVIKNGNKFYEVPIDYNGRTVLEGKKIKFYHFFLVLFQIFKKKIY